MFVMKVGDLVKYNITLASRRRDVKGVGIIIAQEGGTVQNPRYKVMTNGEVLHILVKHIRVLSESR